MALERELYDIEQGFWLGGKDHFLKHVDRQCLLAFPQAGEMHGIHSREEVAVTATNASRWRDLTMGIVSFWITTKVLRSSATGQM